jgi:MFS family permease
MADIQKRILGITTLGHSLSHIYILVFAALLVPISKDFDMSLTAVTGIGAIGYLLYGVGSFPAGLIASVTSPKFTLKIFYLGSTLAAILLGVTTSVGMFGLGLSLLGLFGSFYHVSGLTLISNHVKRVGKSFGIHGAAGSAGITVAPFFASFFASFWGWRSAYLAIAAIGLAGFLLLTFDTVIPRDSVKKEEKKESKPQKDSIIVFFLFFMVILVISGFVYRSFLTIFPTAVSHKLSLGGINPLLTGGAFTSAILGVGILGQYLGGLLSDKISRLLLYSIFLTISAIALIFIGMNNGILFLVAAVLFSLVYFPLQPIENGIISIVTPARFTSSAYGIKFILTFGVGSVGTFFSGYISDTFGIDRVFLLIGFATALAAVISFIFAARFKELPQ